MPDPILMTKNIAEKSLPTTPISSALAYLDHKRQIPGTALFTESDKQNWILAKHWSQHDGHYHCVFQPDNLTSQDLERAKMRAYRLWGEYLRKKRGFADM